MLYFASTCGDTCTPLVMCVPLCAYGSLCTLGFYVSSLTFVLFLFLSFPLLLFPSLQYEEVVDKDDLMGAEDSAKKDILLVSPVSMAPCVIMGSLCHHGPPVSSWAPCVIMAPSVIVGPLCHRGPMCHHGAPVSSWAPYHHGHHICSLSIDVLDFMFVLACQDCQPLTHHFTFLQECPQESCHSLHTRQQGRGADH